MKKISRRLFITSIFLLAAGDDIYGKKKKLVRRKKPLELMGSAEQRIAQNLKADGLNICQITSDGDLRELVKSGILVELTDNSYQFIDRGNMTKPWKIIRRAKGKKKTVVSCTPKSNKVFVRPWVKEYLDRLSVGYSKEFKNKKLKITSGARTLEEQKLMRTKGSCYYTPYAAKASDPLEESLHVRAIVVDVSRKGMKAREISWMRRRLIEDKARGVEFIEESREEPLAVETEPIEESECFHIVVFSKVKPTA